MGAGLSHAFPCLNPVAGPNRDEPVDNDANYDETLGHSFCYVRSSARFISPTQSDRFLSPTNSLRFNDDPKPTRPAGFHETGFRAISGASVSANSSTPPTVLDNYDDATTDDNNTSNIISSSYNNNNNNYKGSFVAGSNRVGVVTSNNSNNVMLDGFESTSLFTALPLQRAPRGSEPPSGNLERAFFMSGPIERQALSGPLDGGVCEVGGGGGVPFSAPLGGAYVKRKRRRSFNGIRKALYRNLLVVPVKSFIGGKGEKEELESGREVVEMIGVSERNDQWALGKAGEDRVHVVVSEELGWLFVGIYDGFNGPDAPEFLMSHLYRAMCNELQGLFWDTEDGVGSDMGNVDVEGGKCCTSRVSEERKEGGGECGVGKKVTFGGEQVVVRRRRLWEFLAEEEQEDGLDLSGSDRFAFSVDDALSVNNAGSAVNRSSLLLSKLKNGLLNKHKGKESSRSSFPWRFWLDGRQKEADEIRESNVACDGVGEKEGVGRGGKKPKVGSVDHELVLSAMARALEVTEKAYLDMTDRVLDRYPELALMGSCLLVALMKDEDVYVMNVGDSRAIVAQHEPEGLSYSEGKLKESVQARDSETNGVTEDHALQSSVLTALQLSTDHSTSIEEEVIRIKNEHPDDSNCIVNDRVKGRLKVTRAFGAGFLKQHKWNDVLLEMFRNDYIGTAPYISCLPSLRHHKLCPRDQFLVLSSDGLYQYFSNEEVVSHVENFMDKYPDGDPAQHLIEELLTRAARKAGMDFHELLDIPQGDRRKYHDDVTVMVVSLEGRIWKSSGKYL